MPLFQRRCQRAPARIQAGLIFTFIIAAFHPSDAHAWGSYAHQQINQAAVLLLYQANPGSAIAQCLQTNSHAIQRFAITPDYDWKFGLGRAPTDPTALRGQHISDQYEHPLHFFEADAFSNNAAEFMKLPSGAGDFNSVLPAYQTLVEGQKSFIAMVDPAKAAITDPIDKVLVHGTAPWRIYQLYGLAVQNLQAYAQNQQEASLLKALIYLGALGHYVGDMSQPLHAAVDYDGQYNYKNSAEKPSHAIGVHAGFESDMFNVLVDEKEDPLDFTYPSFTKTQDNVMTEGAIYYGSNWTEIDKSQIIIHVFELIGDGYKYIPNLIGDFAQDVDANPKTIRMRRKTPQTSPTLRSPSRPRTPASTKTKTGKLTLASEPSMNVLEFAEKRMGDAAALLARLWLSAFIDAGSPGQIGKCPALTYTDATRTTAILSYPIPDYLPAGHEKLPNYPGEPKSINPSAAAIRAFTLDLIN